MSDPRDEHIDRLEGEVVACEELLAGRDARIEQLQAQCDALRSSLGELQGLQGSYEAQKERIAHLMGQLHKLRAEIAERTQDQADLIDSRGRWRDLALQLMRVISEDDL